jgi:hypothetical protein
VCVQSTPATTFTYGGSTVFSTGWTCWLIRHSSGSSFFDVAKVVEPSQKPKFLVIGFYYFPNPELDVVKSALDDPLALEPQGQILDLVKRLSEFKPTKIAIESPFNMIAFSSSAAVVMLHYCARSYATR